MLIGIFRNYAVPAIISAVAGVLFQIQFRNLDKEEDELNELPEGKVFGTNASDDESSHHEKPKVETSTGPHDGQAKVLGG